MPTSFEAIAVLFVAMLPGALYIWSFERMAGRWGMGLSDHVLRFVGASAIVHSILAPATYRLWTERWPAVARGAAGFPAGRVRRNPWHVRPASHYGTLQGRAGVMATCRPPSRSAS